MTQPARTSAPPKAASIWPGMPFMTGRRGAERLHELRPILTANRTQTQNRRDRVLALEWSAKRLCLIFGYTDARQWNGYVPPSCDPLPNLGPQLARPNTSPHRGALVALLRDVQRFEQTGQLPDAGGEA